MMPLISICIPVYGVERYIEKCCHSLFGQSYSNIEYIFVDDCTPDNSIGIIERVLTDYPKRKGQVKIIHHEENKGLSSARNTAISAVTGQYLMHVDSDDYLKEDACEILFKKAEKEKLDLVICNYYKVDEETDKKEIIEIKEFKNTKLKDNKELLLNVNLAPWNKLYKRDLIKKNKIKFVENLKYEDAPFVVETMDKAKRIGQVTEALNYYVIHKNSETTIRDRKVFDIIKIVNIIRKYFSNRKAFTEIINKLSVRILTNYTIQQRMQQDKKIAKEFINQAFQYMQENIPDYKDNKYYENRGLLRRTIEKNKLITDLYVKLYKEEDSTNEK